MKEYAELWNSTPTTRDGTKDLTMVIEYRLKEDQSRAGQIHVVEGEAIYGGAPDPSKKTVDFLLTAKADDWKKLGDGKLSPKPAIMFGTIKFKGSLMVALGHLPALEEAMRMFGKVSETDWSL
jgi:putative sterol carrier protein